MLANDTSTQLVLSELSACNTISPVAIPSERYNVHLTPSFDRHLCSIDMCLSRATARQPNGSARRASRADYVKWLVGKRWVILFERSTYLFEPDIDRGKHGKSQRVR